jgi:hypothetical protein
LAFDAGTSESVGWRTKTVWPVERSTAAAPDSLAWTCGTASARASLVASCGFGEVAGAAAAATEAATAHTARRARTRLGTGAF